MALFRTYTLNWFALVIVTEKPKLIEKVLQKCCDIMVNDYRMHFLHCMRSVRKENVRSVGRMNSSLCKPNAIYSLSDLSSLLMYTNAMTWTNLFDLL